MKNIILGVFSPNIIVAGKLLIRRKARDNQSVNQNHAKKKTFQDASLEVNYKKKFNVFMRSHLRVLKTFKPG